MVHYQSRAQVPAPCVGKARRPPVLQVSTIQTPREGGRCAGDKGGAFSRRCHSPSFAFSSAARAASLGCRPRSSGWAEKEAGRGGGGGGGGGEGGV